MKPSELFTLLEQGETMVRTYNDGVQSEYKYIDGLLNIKASNGSWQSAGITTSRKKLKTKWQIKPKTMSFVEAVEEINNNPEKKMRRTSWVKIRSSIRNCGQVLQAGKRPSCWSPSVGDVLANDWYLEER